MNADERCDELLLHWDDERALGRDLSAEELAADCPELAEPLRLRIEALRATEWLNSEDGTSGRDASSIAGPSPRVPPRGLPPTTLSSNELLERLSDLDLISPEEYDARQAPEERPNDAHALASQLISEGKLTSYQAATLLEGKGDGLLVDKYLILDLLDAGGMGVVFQAVHRPMNRVVALKMLPPHLLRSPDRIKRFQREVRVAATLVHPHIVTAFDADESRGMHFLVMEYISGQDLQKFVAGNGPLTVEQAVDCIAQAAQGLKYAHEKGVIHRDVKPSNLILSPDGVVKVLDLGLARHDEDLEALSHPLAGEPESASATSNDPLGNDEPNAGTLLGTVAFMAPEQATDSRMVDHRTDIYGLGCTLHYLLTGTPPYEAAHPVGTLLAHRDAPLPSLRRVRPDVPEPLDAAFQTMIAKRPADRYQSMDEVIAALATSQPMRPLRPKPSVVAADGNSQTTRRTWWAAGLIPLGLAVAVGAWFSGDAPSPETTSPPTERVATRNPTAAQSDASPASAAPAFRGLIAHWPFEEGAGLTTQDVSGRAAEGTMANAAPDSVWSTDVPPGSGSRFSLTFDGEDDHVALHGLSHWGPQLCEQGTLAVWIKTTESERFRMYLFEGGSGHMKSTLEIGINGSRESPLGLLLADEDRTSKLIRAGLAEGDLFDGQWHHVAVSWSVADPAVDFYIDGIHLKTRAARSEPGFSATHPYRFERFLSPSHLGRFGRSKNKDSFQGLLDDFRIYNRVLTHEEVAALAGTLSEPPPPAP